MTITSPETSALLASLPEVAGTYRLEADLSKVTWFQVGGPAEIMFRPKDPDDLAYFLANKPLHVPVTILGVGSNILIRDGGIKGVVIRLGRGFTEISCQGDEIHAGAGALDYNVALVAQQHGRGGLEFLCGVPGTIGGALAMNAGAYESEIASVLVSADAIDEGGNMLTLHQDDFGFVYRGHTLPDGMLFTKAVFKTEAKDPHAIQERMNEISAAREATQPIKSRTSGSTFKNPDGHKAWQLIDEAGCRGLEMGGAQVSEKHCNFLLNTGNATAKDIEGLGEEVRRRVKEHSGIELQWEIQRIGEESS